MTTHRYGAEQGQAPLREALARHFYPGMRSADEIFVSDGSKCDIARIQMMFGSQPSVAVQVRCCARLRGVGGMRGSACGRPVMCGSCGNRGAAARPMAHACTESGVRCQPSACDLLAWAMHLGAPFACLSYCRCQSHKDTARQRPHCAHPHHAPHPHAHRRTPPTRCTWTRA